MEEKGVTLNFDSTNRDGRMVEADLSKVYEVVANLVDNAIHYSEPGGPVTIALRPGGIAGRPGLILSVTDHGIGIAAEELSHLFTRFGRSEAAKAVRPEGTGLRLYLVKRLVEDHHGRGWVESAGVGKGSTFVVELPAATAIS